jgi:hypothetical protein
VCEEAVISYLWLGYTEVKRKEKIQTPENYPEKAYNKEKEHFEDLEVER